MYKTYESRDLGDEKPLLKLPIKLQKTDITRSGKEDIELIRLHIYSEIVLFLLVFRFVRCSAMSLRNGVADSTGAGDAYIGGFLAGLLNNFQIQVRGYLLSITIEIVSLRFIANSDYLSLAWRWEHWSRRRNWGPWEPGKDF